MVNMGVNPILAVLISLVASTLIGFLNGIIIAEIKMPALIVTFAPRPFLQDLLILSVMVLQSPDSRIVF